MNLTDVIERALARFSPLLKGETMQPTDPTPTDPTPPAPAPDPDADTRVSARVADEGPVEDEQPEDAPAARETGVHVVVDGDTLAAIAAAAQCSAPELVALNKDEYPSLGWNDTLQLGWEIKLPERA